MLHNFHRNNHCYPTIFHWDFSGVATSWTCQLPRPRSSVDKKHRLDELRKQCDLATRCAGLKYAVWKRCRVSSPRSRPIIYIIYIYIYIYYLSCFQHIYKTHILIYTYIYIYTHVFMYILLLYIPLYGLSLAYPHAWMGKN